MIVGTLGGVGTSSIDPWGTPNGLEHGLKIVLSIFY